MNCTSWFSEGPSWVANVAWTGEGHSAGALANFPVAGTTGHSFFTAKAMARLENPVERGFRALTVGPATVAVKISCHGRNWKV